MNRRCVCQATAGLSLRGTESTSVGAKTTHLMRSTPMIPCPIALGVRDQSTAVPPAGGVAIRGTGSSQDQFLAWKMFANRVLHPPPLFYTKDGYYFRSLDLVECARKSFETVPAN